MRYVAAIIGGLIIFVCIFVLVGLTLPILPAFLAANRQIGPLETSNWFGVIFGLFIAIPSYCVVLKVMENKPGHPLATSCVVLMIVQSLLVAVLVFGDIGFDHPGRFGLDFDDVVIMLGLYVLSLVCGIGWSIWRRQWIVLSAQFFVPAVLVFLLLVQWPNPRLDATQYQHLIGKSKQEAQDTLRRHRVVSSGSESTVERGNRDFESYNGMRVYYSRDGHVDAIEAQER